MSYPGSDPYAGYGAAAPGAAPAADPYAAYAAGYAAPPAAPYAAMGGYGSHPDELRTVFVTGFPADVKERELNNLLRFLPGYEASQMHWKGGEAQGFALFDTGMSARAALNSINSLVFDDNAVLRCELARKNMYVDAPPKRSRFEAGGAPPPYGVPPPYGAPPPYGYPPPAAPAPAGGPRAYVPVTNMRDNPPCNTLFIGNLGDSVREEELRALFATQPGFKQMKLIRGAKAVSAFAEFADVPTAMAVHQMQQGAVLASSDRGGIRIQYSKNPFGRKRDINGNYVDTHGSGMLGSAASAGAGGGLGGGAAAPAAGAGEYGGGGAAAVAGTAYGAAPAAAAPDAAAGVPPSDGAA